MLEIGSAFLATIILGVLSLFLGMVLGDIYVSLMIVLIFTVILCTLFGCQYIVQEIRKILQDNKNSAE